MTSAEMKEVLREISLIRDKMERIEELIEERLIGSEKPLKDEVKAIREYEKAKGDGTLELERLEDSYKGG
jgi:phage regulator Rha-like protein